MSELFYNKYVVQVKHVNRSSLYTVISTREDMTNMVRVLGEVLEQPEEISQKPVSSKAIPKALWSDYATIAKGQTANVYLRFAVCNDLSVYHARPKLFGRWALITLAATVLVVGTILASIGAMELLGME
jgi:hypothetical protein